MPLLDEDELATNPEQVFDILEKLGEGSYGSVHKALHKRTQTLCAIKIIPVQDDLEDSIREINFMSQAKYNFVIEFYGSYLHEGYLWIVVEYCEAGSASDIIKLRNQPFTENNIAIIARDVLKGLAYLHDKRKIHRDIKAGNILINAKGESKLADFGVAGQLSDTIAKRNTVVGTPFWMAPEVIQEVGYGVQADIWSFGITMIELAEEKPPYHEIHPMRAMFMIPSKPPPTLSNEEQFSPSFVAFIARCLIKDPTQRPSAVDLLADPFIMGATGDIIPVVEEAIKLNQAKLNKDGEEDEEDSDKEEEEFFASLGSGQGAIQESMNDVLGREPTVMERGISIRHWGTRRRTPSLPSPSFNPSSQLTTGAPISGRTDTVLDSPVIGRRKASGGYSTSLSKINENQPIPKLPSSAYTMLRMVIDNGTHDELSTLLDMIDINLACELANCKDRYDQLKAPLLASLRERGR